MTSGQVVPSRAARELRAALRELHERAGEPSSRSIASIIGGMSHTTVNAALRGNKIPSWPVLSKIVKYLEGNEERFRELWADARDSGSSIDRLPGPRSAASADVSIFVSYARVDDEATYGRITQIVSDLAVTYKSIAGREVGIFKDTASIEAGDDWRDRIRLGLSASSIFVAFISPAYLRSPTCRQEFTEFVSFLTANAANRLIIPLVFGDEKRIERHFEDDELWQRASSLNRLDASALRAIDPGSSSWINLIEKIADKVDEVLTELADQAVEVAVPTREKESNLEVGHLEVLAKFEKTIPKTNAQLARAGELLTQVGEVMLAATPRLKRADTFGKKLGASRRLASDLRPVANSLFSTTSEIQYGMRQWDRGVETMFAILRSSPEQLADPRVDLFLSQVGSLATSGTDAFVHLEGFNATIGRVLGYSADLDRPLNTIRAALLTLAELRGLFSNWHEELAVLRSSPVN